jgi:hypothetical protein
VQKTVASQSCIFINKQTQMPFVFLCVHPSSIVSRMTRCAESIYCLRIKYRGATNKLHHFLQAHPRAHAFSTPHASGFVSGLLCWCIIQAPRAIFIYHMLPYGFASVQFIPFPRLGRPQQIVNTDAKTMRGGERMCGRGRRCESKEVNV